MILGNWLRRFRAGAALCRFDPRSWNRVANVLESIEGVGCRIEKTENGWGWQIIVGDGSDTPLPEGFPSGLPSGGYPFGAEYPFGISISGAAVTVYEQVVYRGGVPLKLAASTVTITADYDWAVLKIVPAASKGEDTLSLVRMADAGGYPPGDDQGNGWILRGLHQFRLANGAASWHKAGWVGADLGMMGY